MSDKETSGSESTARAENAPAETPRAETTPAAEFAFGTGRGPGLARGKRKPAKGAAPASSSALVGDYQPTAVQIVTNESEYTNPFAPPEPEPAPVAEAPAPVANPVEPAPAPEPTAPPTAVAPAPVEPPAAPIAPAAVEAGPEKAELDILPPKQARSSTQRWETPEFPDSSSDARPTFKTRSQRERESQGEDRQSREGRPERRPRADPRAKDKTERRPRAPKHIEVDVPKPKLESAPSSGGGFFGWLKRLFTGGDTKPEPRKRSDGDSRATADAARVRS